MRVINVTSNDSSRTISKCIYCGSNENLSDEHIIPYGLGGPWVLKKASCSNCAKTTSGFERGIVKHFFSLFRAKLDLPTYHPKNRPEEFSFRVKTDKSDSIVNFPVSECPVVFIMPQFEKPGHISGNKYVKGINVNGSSLHTKGNEEIQEFMKKHDIKNLFVTGRIGTNFARVLAKIAYGMVVLRFGLDIIEEAYVLPCILGTKDDVGQWVGCEDSALSSPFPKEDYFHRIEVLSKKNEVFTRIRLFQNYQTPEYLVIVGRIRR